MIWHPLTVTLMLAEVISGLVALSAAARLWIILPGWQSEQDDAGQPARERAMEVIGFQGVWAFVIQSVGLVLLLVGIGNLWPSYVPGAMCGLGVTQAMGGAAGQALAFKSTGLLVLYGWYAALKVEARVPEPTAAGFSGRLFLLAMPFLILGAWFLAKALTGVNIEQPVSCCAAVYDQAAVMGAAPGGFQMRSGTWILMGLAAAVVTVGWGFRLARRPAIAIKRFPIGPVLVIGAAMPVMYILLTRVTAPYVLEILNHPCPWCLFLWEHGAPGFVLFGLPAWLAAESVAVVFVSLQARRHPELENPAATRLRRAGYRTMAAAVLSAAATAAPALWWYWRFGAWMS